MDYFEKVETLMSDLSWNLPEQKQGTMSVIGGNRQSFKTSIKISEFITAKFPIKDVITVLPDALSNELPSLPNFQFLPSTDSGSFASSESLSKVMNSADYNLLIGDFSKNSITRQAVAGACEIAATPTLLTRDTIDLLSATDATKLLLNDQLIFFASMPQLQALLRAVYYPKMLLLSQSLLQVAEVLHKFTLSYSAKIITLHSGQIILAENGVVKTLPLAKTSYAPFTFWNGELSSQVAAYNMFTPHDFMDASLSALFLA